MPEVHMQVPFASAVLLAVHVGVLACVQVMYVIIHHSSVCNSKRLEIIQLSTSKGTVK